MTNWLDIDDFAGWRMNNETCNSNVRVIPIKTAELKAEQVLPSRPDIVGALSAVPSPLQIYNLRSMIYYMNNEYRLDT